MFDINKTRDFDDFSAKLQLFIFAFCHTLIILRFFFPYNPFNSDLVNFSTIIIVTPVALSLIMIGARYDWDCFFESFSKNNFLTIATVFLPLLISWFTIFEFKFFLEYLSTAIIEILLIKYQTEPKSNEGQNELCWNQHNKGEDMDCSDIKKCHNDMTAQYKRKLIYKDRFRLLRKVENQITKHYIKTQQKRILDYVEGLVAERNKQINDLRNNTIFEPNSVTSPYVFYEWYFNMEEVIKYGFELANDLPITMLKNKEDPIIELKLLRREAFNRHNYDLNIKDWDKVSSFDEAIAILSELHEEMGNVLIPTHLSNYEQD